jgi:hypothetical protein
MRAVFFSTDLIALHQNQFFDNFSVWGFFLFMTFASIFPIEVGQWLGARQRRISDVHHPEGPLGNVVAATLALLGFLVALTVGSATARFDTRKEAVIDGVNAIETAYRNAALLPEPHRSESRQLLRDYIDVRIEMPKHFGDPAGLEKLEDRIKVLQLALWSHSVALAEENRSSATYTLYANSLNEVFKLYNKRLILGSQHRIPTFVWVVLIIVTMITMLGVGFRFGLAGTRSTTATLMLAVTYALVIDLIFDIDQPAKGFIDVSQEPMTELHERMHAEP